MNDLSMPNPAPDPPKLVRDTVVIGASAGGIQALRTLVAELPSSFRATVLIVLHIGAHKSTLASILRASGRVPVHDPRDGDEARAGHVYVAPPDRHMLLEYDRIRLSRGPREHHTRPAIDPLFRSAALTRGPRVIGALLTGRLDDGVAGLQAIKECGGVVLVQDPATAEEPGMPASALRQVAVDRVAPIGAIAGLLVDWTSQPMVVSSALRVPVHLTREHAIAMGEGPLPQELDALGSTSHYACPDCGGTLWQIEAAGPLRFRCHTGHAFSMQTLLAAQAEGTETALWTAIRALQEKAMMMRQAAVQQRSVGDEAGAGEMARRVDEFDAQAKALRRLAESLPGGGEARRTRGRRSGFESTSTDA